MKEPFYLNMNVVTYIAKRALLAAIPVVIFAMLLGQLSQLTH